MSDKLNKLLLLPKNWDSYGADPIKPEIIKVARQFMHLDPQFIVPTSKGGVQFEWHRGQRCVELEFVSDNEVAWLQWHPDIGVEEEGECTIGDAMVVATDLVRWFHEC